MHLSKATGLMLHPEFTARFRNNIIFSPMRQAQIYLNKKSDSMTEGIGIDAE